MSSPERDTHRSSRSLPEPSPPERWRRPRWRRSAADAPGESAEGGFVAIEWIAAMAFLLIPVVLIGAGVSRWPERQQVARAAAAEAARAAVLADTHAEAVAAANRVADQVAANYGVSADQYSVTVAAPVWDWGEEVTVTMSITMPALDIPGAGSWGATDWSSSSTQRIEDFRGLE